MNDTLRLYHKHDEFYRTVKLTPYTIRTAINNLKQYKYKLDLYNEIQKDDQFISKKQDRDSIFKKAEWSIESSGNKRIDDFVKEHLWRVLTNNILQDLHEALFAGFSVAEIIWDKNIPAEISPLPQQAFNFKNGKLYIYDSENDKYFEIPENKTIQCFSQNWSNNLPVGLSEVLAPVVALKYSALFRNWAHFNEFVAMPMLWGFYQNEAQKAGLTQGLNSLGKSSIGVLPDGSKIEYVEATHSSPETFEKIINQCNNAISKVVVGQTLTTQSSDSGSYAQAKVHANVRNDMLEDSINLVCDSINTHLIKPLVNFNFNTKTYPEFRLINPVSIEEKAEKDKKLYDLGVRFTPKYFQEQYGLDEDDFTLQPERNTEAALSESAKKKTLLNPFS